MPEELALLPWEKSSVHEPIHLFLQQKIIPNFISLCKMKQHVEESSSLRAGFPSCTGASLPRNCSHCFPTFPLGPRISSAPHFLTFFALFLASHPCFQLLVSGRGLPCSWRMGTKGSSSWGGCTPRALGACPHQQEDAAFVFSTAAPRDALTTQIDSLTGFS